MTRSTRALLVLGLLSAPAAAQVTNAPVAPDTIYVGRRGASGGLSVIDLNGFGASTGDPTYDPTSQTFQPGWSMYPFNPNVRLQGALMRPLLQPGSTTENGGSAGVFTLTRNSFLDDQRNLGILPVAPGAFNAGSLVPINGKHPMRQVNGTAHNTNEATYLFVPVRRAQPGQ